MTPRSSDSGEGVETLDGMGVRPDAYLMHPTTTTTTTKTISPDLPTTGPLTKITVNRRYNYLLLANIIAISFCCSLSAPDTADMTDLGKKEANDGAASDDGVTLSWPDIGAGTPVLPPPITPLKPHEVASKRSSSPVPPPSPPPYSGRMMNKITSPAVTTGRPMSKSLPVSPAAETAEVVSGAGSGAGRTSPTSPSHHHKEASSPKRAGSPRKGSPVGTARMKLSPTKTSPKSSPDGSPTPKRKMLPQLWVYPTPPAYP